MVEVFVFGLIFFLDCGEFGLVFLVDGKEFFFVVSCEKIVVIFFMCFEGQVWIEVCFVVFYEWYSFMDLVLILDDDQFWYIFNEFFGVEGELKDLDFWFLECIEDGWGLLQNVGLVVNLLVDDYYVLFIDECIFYFMMGCVVVEGEESNFDFYVVQWMGSEFLVLVWLVDLVNLVEYDGDVYVVFDEFYFVFLSGCLGGKGEGDFYVSFCEVIGEWIEVKNIEVFNIEGLEYCFFVMCDGWYFFYMSN